MGKISLPEEVEKPLIEKAKVDSKDFAELYEHYYPHIRRFFAVKLKDGAQVDDLTAQTFEKALANLDKFTWRGHPFSAWLYRLANNLLIDHYRSLSKQNYASLESQVVDVPEEKLSMDGELRLEWEHSSITALVQKLPKSQQQILILKFYEGYTNRKIAEMLKISESNVGTILHRVVKKLRREFSKEARAN